MNRVRFQIAGDCLYAANSGRPFDRTGVISICAQHLSAKSERADKISTLDCPNHDLVEQIRALRIRLYEIDPNLLIADRNAEDETSSDYAGRCLLELLQNADDAMAPDGAPAAALIGAKGLGFKAVLEITDNPQIFSGPFSFGFDRERSQEALAGLAVADEVSIFRIPHPAQRDEVVEQLLGDGFATVVKLPLRDALANEQIAAELAALEPHFLLLSQHLERVEVRAAGLARELRRKGARGSTEGADAELDVRAAGKTQHRSRWRVWRHAWPPKNDRQKRLSVAIAIEIRNGRLAPTEEQLPVHVFYPTEEWIGAHFLLHASFDVTQNRQRLRPGKNDEALLEGIAGLAAAIAGSQPPAEVLEVFRRLIAEAPRGKPKLVPRLIQYSIRQALVAAPIVPILGRGNRRVAPSAARLSAPGFASLLNRASRRVADARIARPELEAVQNVLQALESEPLGASDYARLFRDIQCSSPEACLAAARVMLSTCLRSVYVQPSILASLREAPVWPLSGGGVRTLSDPRPLLLARPDDWPQWCDADALDPPFSAELFPSGTMPKEWEKLLSAKLLTGRDQYLEQCVAPAVAAWTEAEWSQTGWDALAHVEQWAQVGEWSKLRPYAPDAGMGTARDALAKVMRVPSGKRWVRARQCYARPEIRGALALSSYFKPVEDRFLCGYPAEAKLRFGAERWRALLRYLGVSWEPKILRLENDPDLILDAADQNGFRNEILRHDGIRYLRRDWHLEAFSECLGGSVPAATLMEMVASLQLASQELRAEWCKVIGTDKTHLPSPYRSFVDYQLRSVPFLPVKANIFGTRLAEGREAFWPQSGIRGITRDLDLGGFKDPRRSTLKPVLASALKFHTRLPDQWPIWLSWNSALVDAVERGDVPQGLHSAREFYELMLAKRTAARRGRSRPRSPVLTPRPRRASGQ